MMNMRYLKVHKILVPALAVLLSHGLTFAGDETKPTGDKDKQAGEKDKQARIAELVAKPLVLFGNDFDIRGLSGPERRAIAMFRYEREVRKLRDTMWRELNLTDTQKTAIDKIVQDQLDYLHSTHGAPRTFSGRQRSPLAKPGSPTALIDPAPGAPDSSIPERERRLDRIRERNRPSASMFDDATAFVDWLTAELSGDQIEKFQKLAYRWRMLRPFGAADGMLRQLARAIRDPDLTINDEQRKSAELSVQEAMRKLGRNRQYADKRLQAYEKAKADVEATLTQEQRGHLEKTLKQLQSEFAEEVLVVMDLRAKNKAPQDAKAGDKNKAPQDAKAGDKNEAGKDAGSDKHGD